MKILFLLYDYYPNPSANTLCTKYIINALTSAHHEVHVLCVKSDKSSKDNEILDGVFVHHIEIKRDVISRRIFMAGNYLTKILHKVLAKYYQLTTLHGMYGYVEGYNSEKVLSSILQVVDVYQIDTLISVSFPFSTHEVCRRVKCKNPSLKWTCYELDPFTFNYTLPTKQLEKRQKKEMECFKYADVIISTMGINELNIKRNFRTEFDKKTISLPLPGLVSKTDIDRGHSVIEKEKDAVNLVYTGQFYGQLRSPAPLFSIVIHNRTEMNIAFHVIGGKVNNELYNNAFIVKEYPRTSAENCDSSIVDGDIAINFDNNIPNQVPSKIISYMSLGVPIINFYFRDCELGELYLKDYDPHLSICIEDIDKPEIIDAFFSFLNEYSKHTNKDKYASVNENLYNDAVCNNFLNALSYK